MAPVTAYISQPRLTVGGQVADGLAADLLSLLVEETAEGLYRCEARFNNQGARSGSVSFLYFGRDVVDFGQEFAVELGPEDAARQVFLGRISALEAEYLPDSSSQVVVLAEDRLQDLRMTRRTRTFEDMSDEDIAGQIASEHSLTPDLDMRGPTHDVVAQVNQSDLAFLRQRARAVGAEVWVEGTTLLARRRANREGEVVTLEHGVNLISLSVRADLAHQVTEVGVTGWDVGAKEPIEETADQAAIRDELGSGTGGSAVLEDAFQARKERVVHTVPLSAEEARGVAEARYRERARRFLTGRGVADGDARLRVGGTVTLSSLGSLFDGDYVLVYVRHTYDLTAGYRTEFGVERPWIGAAQQ